LGKQVLDVAVAETLLPEEALGDLKVPREGGRWGDEEEEKKERRREGGREGGRLQCSR